MLFFSIFEATFNLAFLTRLLVLIIHLFIIKICGFLKKRNLENDKSACCVFRPCRLWPRCNRREVPKLCKS